MNYGKSIKKILSGALQGGLRARKNPELDERISHSEYSLFGKSIRNGLISLAIVCAIVGMNNDSSTIINAETVLASSPSGFLNEGTHPLNLYQSSLVENSETIFGGNNGSNIKVTKYSNGTQTQAYSISNLNFSYNLAGSTGAVNINEIEMEGLLFRTPGKQWRPLTLARLTLPNQTWSWTSNAVTGNATLSFTGQTFPPAVENIDGTATLIQQVRMTLTFSGDVTGTIVWDQFEEIGADDRRRDEIQGSISVSGDTTVVGVIAVLNNLDKFPEAF